MTTATAQKLARNAAEAGQGQRASDVKRSRKGKPAAAPAVEVVSETLPEVAPVEEKTFAQRMIEALKTRNAAQPSKDNEISINAVQRSQTALNALYAKGEWAGICDALVNHAGETDKKHPQFIAVKAMVKIVHALYAIATGIRNEFDPYSRTIIGNLASLHELHNKSALVSLSKSITYDETEQTQSLVRRYDCSVGTASTQASSTRMMLRALGVCEVQKGKQGDTIKTLDNERCTQVLALFAVK